MTTIEEVQTFYKNNKGKGKEVESIIVERGKKLREENENI
jgi:hypothetical protein